MRYLWVIKMPLSHFLKNKLIGQKEIDLEQRLIIYVLANRTPLIPSLILLSLILILTNYLNAYFYENLKPTTDGE